MGNSWYNKREFGMDQIAEIREKIDIVSFIAEYLPLKKAGRNFSALCPFHTEKSPSFVISPERQIWHCFGCQKGGDIYTFLMEYDRMEFGEALRQLAKQAGVELKQHVADTGLSAKKEGLYKINALAAEYYHYILTSHAAGKKALAYLKNRGIHDKLLKTFKLGFAPISGRALSQYLLQKKGYAKEDLIEAGLVYERGQSVSDFFRGRLIFPLISQHDNVLGFSGRLLDEAKGYGGKYINTRDTLVYHKREHFFGLNVTKDAIRKADQAILVEGEFDVMSCFQEGISNVVAVKGTALTEQQIRLLGRYAQKISICFDGDSAGQEAIKRSLPLLEKKGLQTTVILIPSGKDPDESLRTEPGAFKDAVKHDKNVYDYLFDHLQEKFGTTTPDGKQQMAEGLLPLINGIENAIIREHYLRKLATAIATSYDSILKELDRVTKKETKEVKIPRTKLQRTREEVLEEYLLALVLQNKLVFEEGMRAVTLLGESVTGMSAGQKLLTLIAKESEKGEVFDQKQFGNILPKELVTIYDTALLFPLPTFPDDKKNKEEITKVATDLRNVYLKHRLKVLGAEITVLEQEGKDEEAAQRKEEYSKFVMLLRKA